MRVTKSANLIQIPLIVTYSFIITAIYSIRAMLAGVSATNEQRRAKGDLLTRSWSEKLLRIIKVNYRVHNDFHFEPGKPYIVMCNHNSVYDIPLSFMAINGSMRMIAKKELAPVPLLGRAMRAIDFIFIDRKNHEQAVRDLDLAKQKMSDGIIIWICPEGTRSHTGKLLPLKPGGFMMAIQTGATIVPLGLRGTQQLLSPASWNIQLNHHVDMYFGKPIDATQYTVKNRHQLIADVKRELMLAADLETT